jgi:iron complex transport system substrate-binding protein
LLNNSKPLLSPGSLARWPIGAGAQGHRIRLTLTIITGLLLAHFGSTSCASPRVTSAGELSFTDELGRTIKVKTRPERIVSLAPSVTETLFALGLGDRVIGVTSYCDYPPEAAHKEKVGDTQRPSIEKIIALGADLVIASTASQLEQFVKNLDQLGIPVYVSNPRDLEGVIESIARIGEVTGASEAARALAGKLRDRLSDVESRLAGRARPRVFLILSSEPLITTGGKSFFNDLITRAGGLSISADQNVDYPLYSMETAVAEKPEVIFLQSGDDRLPDRLKQTPASQAGRVFHISDDLLLRPGPRIMDGLEQMAAAIHPEAYGQGK